MITIFSTCKPMVGIDAQNQSRAIQSWQLLQPASQVILMGKEWGTRKIAEELGCSYCEVECNQWGTPLIPSLFQQAEKLAVYNLLCYVNTDIVLLNDFMEAVQIVSDHFSQFLMIGRRWDLDETTPDLPIGFERQLRKVARKHGTRKKPTGGSDYFVFPKKTFDKIPPLAVGTRRWDLWVIRDALNRSIPVVDATLRVLAIHQWHPEYPRAEEEVRSNMQLVSGSWATVNDATWKLIKSRLRKKGN